MTDPTLDPSAEAARALHAAVEDYGQAALSNPQMLTNLFKDLLPTLPREASLLVQAAEAGVADTFVEHIGQQMPPDAAVRLTAATFGQRRALDQGACSWATAQFAAALGYPVTIPPSLSADVSAPPPPTPQVGQLADGDLGTTVGASQVLPGAPAAPGGAGPTIGAPPGAWTPGGPGPNIGPLGGPPAGPGGPPGGGGPTWGGPTPGQGSSGGRRTPLLIGGGATVLVVIVVLVVLLASNGSSGSSHTTTTLSPPTTQVAPTNAPSTAAPTTAPTGGGTSGGFVDIAQLVPSDINARTDCHAVAQSNQPAGLVGSTSALSCTDAGDSSQNDPGLPNGFVYGFQFDNSADFITSLQALNRDNSFDPTASGTGTSCPPASGDNGGQVPWNNNHYQGELECYSNTSGGPVYVWTIPAQNAIIVAVGESSETPAQLDNWWTNFSGPSS
jgi:hypothetical protein